MCRSTLAILILALLSPIPARPLPQATAGPAEKQAPEESAAYRQAMGNARMEIEGKNYKGAIRHYRKARQAAGGPTVKTELGLAEAFNKIKAFRDAEECARRALELSPDPYQRLLAYIVLGTSLYSDGKADEKRLEQSVEAFRWALELSGGSANSVRVSLAVALLKLERDDEGLAMLREYLAQDPDGKDRELVQALLANPERARIPLVPEFEVVTLEGRFLTPEDFAGKVILLDFWATWCPPCRDAIPHLRRMSHWSNKKPFVVLSISVDSDEERLRDFVSEHRMTWPQVWDETHELAHKTFGVRHFPTHLLIDHRGVVRFRHTGWSQRDWIELEHRISSLVREAKRAAR